MEKEKSEAFMFSLTENTLGVLNEILANSEALGCEIKKLNNGTTIVDMGLRRKGSWKAALLYTRATIGDLGVVNLGEFRLDERRSFSSVEVFIDQPMIACVAAEMADWRIGNGEYAVIVSGPARAQAAVESDHYIKRTKYRDHYDKAAIACLQTVEYPDEKIAAEIAKACHVKEEDTYLLVSSSTCLTASAQVSARIIEQSCNKLFVSGKMSPEAIVMARGNAPIAPIVKDEDKMMGRINDALIYGSTVELWLDASDEKIAEIAPMLVAKHSSPCYGKPFEEIFIEHGRNFFNIPLDVHSIGRVIAHSVNTGKAFDSGEIDYDVLRKSFLS